MNKSLPPVDAVAAAREVLADRHKAFTVSTVKLWAICQAVVDAHDNPQPVITTELADATRRFISAHVQLLEQSIFAEHGALLVASNEAFRAFKAHFETEFPHVSE